MLNNLILSEFFSCGGETIKKIHDDFFQHTKYLQKIFSKDKSLSIDESFILYLIVRLFHVQHIAELGVRYGISTRFWLKTTSCKVSGYDLKRLYNKRLKKIDNTRFHFILGDIKKTWKKDNYDLIFYDAHPYDLTHQIASTSKEKVKIHCFHDVGKGCFNILGQQVPKESRTDIVTHGHWERHVMAEVFNAGILTNQMDIGNEWRSLIVDDKHGLGISIHNSILGEANAIANI